MIDSASMPCNQSHCFVPDVGCADGHVDFTKCPNYRYRETEDSAPNGADDDERFPWTARQLGIVDLRFISATRRPHLIGIVGAADSGKTTLLCLLFLAIYRGHKVGPYRFAGSYSLLGWENIARYMQLNAGDAIQFPPHTPRTGRVPGLLHLAVAENNIRQREIVLTDASGEWFSAWTDKPGDETAAGARWIARHADRMLIIADTAALTGVNRGAARRELEFLIRRVKSEFGEIGVALVWTKSDLERPKRIRQDVESHFLSCFPDAPIFTTGVPDSDNGRHDTTLQELDAVFSWAFEKHTRRVFHRAPEHHSSDPFISYRGAQ